MTGEFKNNRIYKAEYKKPDGSIYVGEFDENGKLFHGQGNITEPDGLNYTGEFKNGLRHGRGTLTTTEKAGRLQLTFDWKDDKPNFQRNLCFQMVRNT